MKIHPFITTIAQMTPLICTCFLASAEANIPAAVDAISQRPPSPIQTPWWKNAVFYQIYIRSFKDSNGDGIGDFKGIIEKLDYLQHLGVNTLLISPHYDSPNIDNGYDIRDYKQVMKEFGTMADFDRLISELRRRGMRLIIDIVANHTSDTHAWFKKSQESKTSPFRDFYFWRDGKGSQPPNNYLSIFGGPAWEFDTATQQYYLHYFSTHQPDLNWDNPNVRAAIYDSIGFWLDKGVSGLRFDSIPTISKFTDFPMVKKPEMIFQAYNDGPHVHTYLREIHDRFKPRYDIVTLGEMAGIDDKRLQNYAGDGRNELDVAISLNLTTLGRDKQLFWKYRGWTVKQFRHIIGQLHRSQHTPWTLFFLSNHDIPRALSYFGIDHGKYRSASAKALATITLTQRATPIIYQGEEIGMTNYPFQSIDELHDLRAHRDWDTYVVHGTLAPTTFFTNVRKTSRDNSRTPFQWDNSAYAGFSTTTPWMKINPNYVAINAKAQISTPTSIFNYYRQLIAVRQKIPAFTLGNYRDVSPNGQDIYAYTRTLDHETYLIVVNFSKQPQTYPLPETYRIASVIIDSSARPEGEAQQTAIQLAPWQSGIYRLSQRHQAASPPLGQPR